MDGKPLTPDEIKDAADEFWSTRKKPQRVRTQPPEYPNSNTNSETGDEVNGSQ
jgi:hypothetical protein